MAELVAVVLTLNEEKNIGPCLDSLQWCDAIVVWDSFSTDRTCDIARAKGAALYQHPFKGYGSQRQAAMDAVCERLGARWVFFVDADERATPELAHEIRRVIVERPDVVGWWVPRHNYILSRLTLHAGWYPDHQLRLLRPCRSHWDPAREVHELPILNGAEGYLQNVLIHYNYDSIKQFIETQEKYTDIDARILYDAGQRPKPWSPFSMPVRHFKWRFIDLKGYRDGLHGLWLSLMMSYYEGQKYRRLAKLWREKRQDVDLDDSL
jgi:glycosyltransferase involved in cell wall biosynthesis